MSSQPPITKPLSGIKPCLIKHPKYSEISPFGHPYTNSWSNVPSLQKFLTVEEIAMINLSWEIRKKPEWWIKYKNPEIVAKWKREAQEEREEDRIPPMPEREENEEEEDVINAMDEMILPIRRRQRQEGRIPLRDSVFQYVIDELAYYEQIRDQTNGQFQNGSYLGIIYGDNVVPENLKKEFIQAARKLEDVPESAKDWHPGSNKRVLDLVHPSLYPLQYGITPVVADMKNDHVGFDLCYKGKLVSMHNYDVKKHSIKKSVDSFGIGKNYQWLPSLFEVSDDGSKVTIKSYINNLHPVHHKDLYKPIGDIFKHFIPAINMTLTQYATGQRLRIDYSGIENFYYGPEPEDFTKLNDRDPEAYYDAYDRWINTREPKLVDPVYKPIPVEDICTIDVKGTTLKVIVKMANIELTPERPDYSGGSWHVEGTINEDIVCTCLYYYDCENITHSELQFRAGCADPDYEQSDSRALIRLFGVDDEEELTFSCGGIEAKEDRLVVFPNMYQHRVAPFELKDKTRPGHRKILCFFVCDPYNDNVVSTDQVPPQQANWWAEQTFAVDSKKNATLFNKLPPELMESILEKMEWPMPLSKAKEVRKKLMEERAQNNSEDDYDNAYQRAFSLCEH